MGSVSLSTQICILAQSCDVIPEVFAGELFCVVSMNCIVVQTKMAGVNAQHASCLFSSGQKRVIRLNQQELRASPVPAPFSVIQKIRTPRLCSIIGLYHCHPQRQAAADASLMFF